MSRKRTSRKPTDAQQREMKIIKLRTLGIIADGIRILTPGIGRERAAQSLKKVLAALEQIEASPSGPTPVSRRSRSRL